MGLTNAQYNAIQREYDEKKSKNKRVMKARELEIFSKIPAVKSIADEIITNSIEAAKLAILGDETAIEQLKEKNCELSMCKAELLISNNYPANYLEPIFSCPDCKDTGLIGNTRCRCFKQAIMDHIYSQAEVKEIIKDQNFSNFRYDFYDQNTVNELTGLTPYENILKVVTQSKNFIDSFPNSKQNLLIYGNAGVGKTFLANSIANELQKKAITVIYLTAFQLFELLQKNKFQKSNEQYNKATSLNEDFIYDCDVLIIDDLGTEFSNSFTNSELYNCINERSLKQKSTIISTNYSLDELSDNYSERIYSRLIGNYTLLNVYGSDIRFVKRMRK